MSALTLKAKRRETGKQVSKRIRSGGSVPGVFYMRDTEPIHISTQPLLLRPVVYTAFTRVISLEVEGDTDIRECVLKDVVFDPVTENIVHFDLLGIKKGQKLTVEIPIVLVGQAAGVREGGVLQHVLHRLKVTCTPGKLREQIELDISELNIGDAVHLSDIDTENFEVDIASSAVICSVVPPRVATEDEVEDEELAEGEGEEGAEGEDEKAEGGEE